jgi:multidrug resistance efflux pump
LQRLIEDVDEKPPANAQADIPAVLKNEKPAPVTGAGLPTIIPFKPVRKAWRLRFLIGLFVVLFAAGGAGFYWWKHAQSQLPAGISWGNGRLEADEIDIDTKFPGRIAELRVDIGDMVTAGQVVARMDTRDLQESLKKSEAQVKQAQRAIEEANANLEHGRIQYRIANIGEVLSAGGKVFTMLDISYVYMDIYLRRGGLSPR